MRSISKGGDYQMFMYPTDCLHHISTVWPHNFKHEDCKILVLRMNNSICGTTTPVFLATETHLPEFHSTVLLLAFFDSWVSWLCHREISSRPQKWSGVSRSILHTSSPQNFKWHLSLYVQLSFILRYLYGHRQYHIHNHHDCRPHEWHVRHIS